MNSTFSQRSSIATNYPISVSLPIGLTFAIALLIFLASPTPAAITWSGNVLPTNPTTWTASTNSTIGSSSAGLITVNGGSVLQSNQSMLGSNTSATGTISITDAGSVWNIGSALFIGNSGNGTLNINSGGQVNDSDGYISLNSGSIGTATVTGVGSTWTNRRYLYVGYKGSGTLTVSDSGMVTVNNGLFASLNSLFGNGTISTNGGVLDADLVFDSAHGLENSLAFGSGGTLNFIQTGSSVLGAGYKGNGTIKIADGTVVTSSGSQYVAGGCLGFHAGSTGIATVTGPGSMWENSSSLDVGSEGTGTLNITAGGQVTNSSGYIGHYSSASGNVMVTGTGSKWTNSSTLGVGYSGNGVLNIEAGGQVSSLGGYMGYYSSATGTITVSGLGSLWTANYSFEVGRSGNGTLIVKEGGQVIVDSTQDVYLGHNSGSNGTATVTDANSKWIMGGSLYVGNDGYGALNVNNGATLTVGKTIYTSLNDISGNGAISANGGVIDGNWIFDPAHGLQKSFTFGAGGILTVNQSASNDLGAGYKDSGTLRVSDGFAVSSSKGYLGYHPGSNGTATVTGDGSKWTTSSSLFVGSQGDGTLNIEAGGLVNCNYGSIGASSTSTGTAIVTGAGSKWINSGQLLVGPSGNGTLNIRAGGQISNTEGYLGYASGGTGTVTISDANSKWTNSSNLYLGYSGFGTLNILAGGQVSNKIGELGYNSGSSGTVMVSGGDSKWTCGTTIDIGRRGVGLLNVTMGGQFSCITGYLGYYSGATGTATVSGAGSIWACSYSMDVGRSGNGTLNVESAARVTTTNTSNVGYDTGSIGTVKVTGIGSMWNSGCLYLGFFGTGTLTVESGAGMTSSSASFIGFNSGSSGTATITGTGSSWACASLYVGYSGNGTLNLSGDSLTSLQYLTLGSQNGGKATCNLDGGTLRSQSISRGSGSADFNWSDGTIRNYDYYTNLTINGTNSLRLQLASTGTHAFNIDAGRMGTVSAILSDATSGGTLVKQGDGLLILNGNNTYTGTTTIEGGQLKLVAGGNIAFSSEIINRAGFLIDGGNHTVQKITGSGTTQVLSGSLTAASIVQDTLTIGGPANAVPEPSTLILLALSALAILAWRRKSSEK